MFILFCLPWHMLKKHCYKAMNKHIVKALLNLAETSFESCFKISLPGRFSKYGKLNICMTESDGILTFCGITASELIDCNISSGEQIFACKPVSYNGARGSRLYCRRRAVSLFYLENPQVRTQTNRGGQQSRE